jgi:hypothetical protein
MSIEIPRDRYKRPLIIPVGGGKPIPYYRASSFGDVLDDRSNLEKYLRRMAVKGMSTRPDITFQVSVTPLTEKWKLNQLVEDAIEAAGGGQRASLGTSLHSLTEMMDRGDPLPPFPAEYAGDLAAYRAATSVFTHQSIETFLVNDIVKAAGTPDRTSTHAAPLTFGGGKFPAVTLPPATRVTDLKTGGHKDYLGGHAIQLAIYSRAVNYDPATGERTPLDVDQDWGVIFHAPAGEGTCTLYAVDLNAGWEGALLAAEVRAWRKRKGLATPAAPALSVAA